MDDITPPPDPGPPDVFWEDDLEMPVGGLRSAAESDEFMTEWLARRSGAQVAMLRYLLHLDEGASTRTGRKELQDLLPRLRRFVLVQQFARHKLTAAVVDFAERRLPPQVMAIAQVGESYDRSALIYAIYEQDWRDLALVYQIEKIHRRGFARMRLSKTPRRPETPLGDFLGDPNITAVLADYDRKAADGRLSQFRSHIPYDGTDLVFIRRADKAAFLMQGPAIVHGFAPEWIILDFRHGGSRVNICSESTRPSLEIANAIASAYYDRRCEYENDRVPTYPEQIRRLLDLLLAEQAQELTLVEVRVRNSPLSAAPKLVLSAEEDGSIAPAIRQLTEAFGPMLANLHDVAAIKTLFRRKRVSVIFDDGRKDGDPLPASDTNPGESPFVVRYTDHILTVAGRVAFERLMEEVHGIAVVSTEKRFRH